MLNWDTELSSLYINYDWNLTPKLSVIANQPEMGNPIRRLRSNNVKHTVSCSSTMSYDEYNNVFYPFIMKRLHGGIDGFFFRSFIDGKTHQAYLEMNDGSPFTVKRSGSYSYIVNFTIVYVELGGTLNA